VGDFNIVDHTAAYEGDFAADARGDIDHLLDPMDGRRKTRKDDAAWGGTAKFFDARDDVAFGAGEAGALDVGGVAEEGENTFVAVTSEGVEVEGSATDGSLVDLEVAGMNYYAEGSAHGERDAIDRAVGYRNEFDFERANFDEAATGDDLAEGGGLEQASFVQALLYECEGEARAVHGHVQVAKDVWERPDVVFVAMREDDGANVGAILLKVSDVGNDEIDAEKLGFREHHAGVDDEDVVADPQGHHVHAEFAEAAERDGG
jgi:hypothetical protein